MIATQAVEQYQLLKSLRKLYFSLDFQASGSFVTEYISILITF